MNDKSKFTTKDYLLSIQHLFAMFGATVLVPLLTGLNPSLALFSAGVGTLIFHLCTKFKVPVFLGSSFAFLAAITAIVRPDGASPKTASWNGNYFANSAI
ncbi:MAG: solute carrier family 23 protein [Hungatella hathewayi]